MQLYGDNFAPTESLGCRYALEHGTTDGGGGTDPLPAYLPATFVSVSVVLCAAPASALPRSTDVSASTDGKWWGPTDAVYTYYDPTHAPVVSRVEPPYG